MNEWIKKMWFIYLMEYYSDIRKDEILPICYNMDGISRAQNENTVCSHSYVEPRKIDFIEVE